MNTLFVPSLSWNNTGEERGEKRSSVACINIQTWTVPRSLNLGGSIRDLNSGLTSTFFPYFQHFIDLNSNRLFLYHELARKKSIFSTNNLLYRVFSKNVFFPQNVVIFLNSASSAVVVLVIDLPLCVHTLTPPRENREKPESGMNFKNFEKKHDIL